MQNDKIKLTFESDNGRAFEVVLSRWSFSIRLDLKIDYGGEKDHVIRTVSI